MSISHYAPDKTNRTLTDLAVGVMQKAYSRGPLTRFGIQYFLDALGWTFALVSAALLRYDFDATSIGWLALTALCLLTALVQLFSGWLCFLYRGRHPYGSFAELQALLLSVALTAAIVAVPLLLAGTQVRLPRSIILIALPFVIVFMGGARYFKRVLVEKTIRPAQGAARALVFGAGYMGSTLVRRMVTDRWSMFEPVGFIDDNPHRRNAWFDGVRVLGTRQDLARTAVETEAEVLIIAIARADSKLLTEITDAAKEANLSVMVLPPLEEILEGKSRLRDLRDISIEDLIGRHPVDTKVESIAGYLQGKRVLVTGAGGSIGSELCRQITKFHPAELMMLDRDETGLQTTQLSISGQGLLESDDVVLADIRDEEALRVIFEKRRPEVVFHAAALKHLPMLEQYPDEGWKTNVIGTLNVLRASLAIGVDTFVNVSTDKAANPTSILGHSKRVGEKLTAWAAKESGKRYLSVRFGNVIGSRGSMLPTFTTLIEAGGPLTITHPDITRYFMTIPEACQLVVQAGGIGRAAEVLILDMGEPVKILDIAQRMIDMSGKDIAIVYTGLRVGEKLNEELIGIHETDERPIHPKISHTLVNAISPEHLEKSTWDERCRNEKVERVTEASATPA